MKRLPVFVVTLLLSFSSVAIYASCASWNVKVTCDNGHTFDSSLSRCWKWSKVSCQLCHSKDYYAGNFEGQCGNDNFCVKMRGGNIASGFAKTFAGGRCIGRS